MAKYLEKKGDDKTSLKLTEIFLTRYPNSDLLDEVLYLLGNLYEKNTDYRDFKKAVNVYKRLYNEFPESNFFDLANDRIKYINRYFFHIN